MTRRVRLESNVIVALGTLGMRHARYTSTKAELGLAEDMTTVLYFFKVVYIVVYIVIHIYQGFRMSLLPSHSIYSTSKGQCFFCWVNHVSIIHSHSKKGTVCEEIVIVPYDNTTN